MKKNYISKIFSFIAGVVDENSFTKISLNFLKNSKLFNWDTHGRGETDLKKI
jgi:hypothetical protein